MLALPPVDPVVGWRATTRLPRDHYVRLDSNDYSVHPGAVGRRVEVVADLEQVVVTSAGVEVARHVRCWANHQSITDPDHAAAAAQLRAARALAAVPAIDTDVENRDLADYDHKPFGRWGEVFGDDVVAAAMIDRLVHHADVVSMKGDSYRLKDRDLGRVPAATKTSD
jgi:hypothetical protein